MRETYTKEAHVKDDVKAILNEHGWFWFMPPANAYGKSGISDIICLRTEVFMAIECKFGTNKPTAMQIGFLNSIRAEGGFAFVVSDRNIEWFKAFMESFDVAAQCTAMREKIPEAHGARMANGLIELSNKFLDTTAPPATAVEAVPPPPLAAN